MSNNSFESQDQVVFLSGTLVRYVPLNPEHPTHPKLIGKQCVVVSRGSTRYPTGFSYNVRDSTGAITSVDPAELSGPNFSPAA